MYRYAILTDNSLSTGCYFIFKNKWLPFRRSW